MCASSSSGWVVYAASFPSLASRCPYRLKWVAVSLVLSTGETLWGKGSAWFLCSYFSGNLLEPIKSIVLSICIFNFSSIYHIAYFCIRFHQFIAFAYSCATILSHKFADSHLNLSHLLKKCCTQIKWIVIGYALFSLYIDVFFFLFCVVLFFFLFFVFCLLFCFVFFCFCLCFCLCFFFCFFFSLSINC